MKNRRILLGVILVVISSIILISYINFRMIKVSNLYEQEFKDKLMMAVQEESSFHMKDLTSFGWDRVFIIRPYTSKKEIQEIVGKKWTTYNTYAGYLIEKTYYGQHPLDDDVFHKLVFIKDEKVVLDVTIERTSADFLQLDGIMDYDNDFLLIDKTGDSYPIIRRIK